MGRRRQDRREPPAVHAGSPPTRSCASHHPPMNGRGAPTPPVTLPVLYHRSVNQPGGVPSTPRLDGPGPAQRRGASAWRRCGTAASTWSLIVAYTSSDRR
ncbi:hypothetical protein [Ornithinimicrobium kibberense]|uniref:hypothetical protein n=1 Tax=Ornithinimicrobium kibberense TaxID=282060 RepID=UPI00360B9627